MNNCEDFAIYCKTSLLVVTNICVGQSGQAASCLAAASAVVSLLLRFMTASFGVLHWLDVAYCVSRYVSDIGVRCDVAKVQWRDI
uniref:LRAT domain-containing protein n=1 Tax=Glycine max TaxID=3847 RepID=C6TFU2_SOYBN|nr:unknown [Glycine max]